MPSLSRTVVATLLFALLTPVSAIAQDFIVSGVEIDASASSEQIESAIAGVEARDDLADAVRAEVVELLRAAQSQVQNRRVAEAAALAFAASIEEAPGQTQVLRDELDQPLPPPPEPDDIGVDDGTTLVELEQMLALELAARSLGATYFRTLCFLLCERTRTSRQTDPRRPGRE